jgi:hypothetical protein
MAQNKFQDFAKELVDLCDKYNYQLEGCDDSSVMVTIKGECAYNGDEGECVKLSDFAQLVDYTGGL